MLSRDPHAELSRCHHLHPKPALPASGTGLGWPRTDTTVPVSDTQRWISNGCNYGTDSRLGPPKGRPQNGGHPSIRNGLPKTMSPHSGGTYFGGCKVHLQIGPYLAAIKRSLLLEISERMSLLASTRQRSNGSDGDSGPAGQAVSQPMHGRCSHTLAIDHWPI